MIACACRAISPGEGHAAGRALLAQLYRVHVGGELPPIVVEERGKPRFVGSDIHFSISHTRHHVFCAISHRPIGIDAEEADRSIDLRLADKILSPAEKARFASAEDKRLALLSLWVLKEAAGKQSGYGINANPNHTDFSPDDPRITVMEGCLVAVIE